MCLARIPEMDMAVHKTRRRAETRTVKNFEHLALGPRNQGGIQPEILPDTNNLALCNQNVSYPVRPGRRIQEPHALQHNHSENTSPSSPVPSI